MKSLLAPAEAAAAARSRGGPPAVVVDVGWVNGLAAVRSLGRAGAPGNVRLEVGEGGLPKASVVNVSQLYTVDKAELTERLGELSPLRVREVISGIELLLDPLGSRGLTE